MPTKGLGIGAPGFGFLGNATLPGGNVKAIPYAPKAVQFSAPAYLSQPFTSISDCLGFTYSGWLKRPTAGAGQVLEFGDTDTPGISRITVQSDGLVQAVFKGGIYGSTGGGQSSQALSLTSPIGVLNDSVRSHVFVTVLASNPEFDLGSNVGSIYVNGALVCNSVVLTTGPTGAPVSAGQGILVRTFEIGIPHQGASGPDSVQDFSDVQIWFGTYIDPTFVYGFGAKAKNPQPTIDGKAVTPQTFSLIGMVVDSMNAAGVDAGYAMTVLNIESAYGTNYSNKGTPKGIFQFNQSEMDVALGAGKDATDANNQTQTFVYYNTTTSSNSWLTPALVSNFGSDPTGIYRYTVFNQGNSGSSTIWSAADAGKKISDLSMAQQQRMIPTPATPDGGQAWAKSLTAANFVQTWLDNLQTYWNTQAADASNRLTGTPLTNINAFIDPDGNQVPVATAAALFGAPSILFTGNAASFPANLGYGGGFSLINGPLTDAVPWP